MIQDYGGGSIGGTCSVYNGDVCLEALQALQSCLPDEQPSSDNAIYISPEEPQADVEMKALLLFQLLD